MRHIGWKCCAFCATGCNIIQSFSRHGKLTIPHRLVYTVSTHRTHRHSRNGTNNGFRPPGTNNRLHMVHPIGGVLIPRLEKLNLLAMDHGRDRKTRIIITTTSMEKKRWSNACLFGNIHDGILEHQGARRNRRGHSPIMLAHINFFVFHDGVLLLGCLVWVRLWSPSTAMEQQAAPRRAWNRNLQLCVLLLYYHARFL